MGVYHYVDSLDLKGSPQVSVGFSRLKENGDDGDTFYLDWIVLDNGQVDLNDGDYEFKWMGDFESDLLFLQDMGVRGRIEISSEFHDYFRFVLDDEGVKYFTGQVIYGKFPDGSVTKDSIKL
jgi:hypothetical protein